MTIEKEERQCFNWTGTCCEKFNGVTHYLLQRSETSIRSIIDTCVNFSMTSIRRFVYSFLFTSSFWFISGWVFFYRQTQNISEASGYSVIEIAISTNFKSQPTHQHLTWWSGVSRLVFLLPVWLFTALAGKPGIPLGCDRKQNGKSGVMTFIITMKMIWYLFIIHHWLSANSVQYKFFCSLLARCQFYALYWAS